MFKKTFYSIVLKYDFFLRFGFTRKNTLLYIWIKMILRFGFVDT